MYEGGTAVLNSVTKRYMSEMGLLEEKEKMDDTSNPLLLHSELPRGEFEALLQRFVAGLPDRLRQLDAAVQQCNWEDVARLSHQIRGAAGSYGYPSIADEAWRMEQIATGQKSQGLCFENFSRMETLCLGAQRALEETFHSRG